MSLSSVLVVDVDDGLVGVFGGYVDDGGSACCICVRYWEKRGGMDGCRKKGRRTQGAGIVKG